MAQFCKAMFFNQKPSFKPSLRDCLHTGDAGLLDFHLTPGHLHVNNSCINSSYNTANNIWLHSVHPKVKQYGH